MTSLYIRWSILFSIHFYLFSTSIKIVVEPHHQVAQPNETRTYEDNIDEEEAQVDIDLRRFSSDHHYQVESN